MKNKLIIIGPENLIEVLCLFESLSLFPLDDLGFSPIVVINQELQNKLSAVANLERISLVSLSLEELNQIKNQGKFPKILTPTFGASQSSINSSITHGTESDFLLSLNLNPNFFELIKKADIKFKHGFLPSSQNKIVMTSKWEHLLFSKYYGHVPHSFTEIYTQLLKECFKKHYANQKILNDIIYSQSQLNKKISQLTIKECFFDKTSDWFQTENIAIDLTSKNIKNSILENTQSLIFNNQQIISEQTLVITDNYINSKLLQMQGFLVICLYNKLSDFFNFSNYSDSSLNIYIPGGQVELLQSEMSEKLLSPGLWNNFIEQNVNSGLMFIHKSEEHMLLNSCELIETEQVLYTTSKVFWDFFLNNYTQAKKIFFSSQAICQEIKRHLRDLKIIQVSIIEFMNYCLNEQGSRHGRTEIFIHEINRHEEVIKLCAKNAHPLISGVYQFNRAQMSNKSFQRPELVVEFLILNYRELYSCYEAVEELLNLSLESHVGQVSDQAV
ncbi:MAG: hypothetical protein QE271_13465 [Bacteriovoracaceae bacterium]|nr:hypothetical protein [Bacteriovoracaceae bacterium]